MSFMAPAMVIDVGSFYTRAGFSSDDLPRLVYSTSYIATEKGPMFSRVPTSSSDPVMTITEDGLVYDFDALSANWAHAYANIDSLPVVSNDQPLVLTEPAWNTLKHRARTAQLAFESFSVPLFSLIKTPLAQLYRAGRLTGLVVDVGAACTLVTPILDGIVQTKCAFHLPYAGNFIDAHALATSATPFVDWVPPQYRLYLHLFQSWHVAHNALLDYKTLVLSRPDTRQYVIPESGAIVPIPPVVGPSLVSPLFTPQIRPLPGMTIPEPHIDKPRTHGLTNILVLALKKLEQQTTSQQPAGSLKFGEDFSALLQLLVICGGTSLSPGLVDRLIAELRAVTPKYFPGLVYHAYNATEVSSSDAWERLYGSWLGACNLATMLVDGEFGGPDPSLSANIALNNWFVSKPEYEELGEDLIAERFK